NLYAHQLQSKSKDSHLRKMKQELLQLENNPDYTPQKQDLDQFYKLFERYLNTKDKKIVWEEINPPTESKIVRYEDLSVPDSGDKQALLSKLAVLKLNGGLGTTMGCEGPKSAIQVRDGRNFLDLTVKQVEHLNRKYNTEVPLILMNSFNTDKV